MDFNTYRQTGEIEDGLLIQRGLLTEDGIVKGVSVVWQANNFEKLAKIVGELYTLLDQYGYNIIKEENDQTILLINGYTIMLRKIAQTGRIYTFVLSLY
jgi:hypothetical protein